MNHNIKHLKHIRTIDEFKSDKSAFKISDYFDLSGISRQDLLSKFTDLSILVNNLGYGHELMIKQDGILVESKYHTAAFETVKKTFIETFLFDEWQIKEIYASNKIKIIILFIDYKLNENIVVSEMKALGWSKSHIDHGVLKGINIAAISFDPVYQMSVSDEAKSFERLFHWTPEYNVENIFKYGLLPKSENIKYDYPKRVHLIKGNIDEYNKIFLGWQLCQMNDDSKNDGNYSLIQVETKLIPSHIAFYYHPRYERGYYIKRKIPRDALKIIGNVRFKKEKTMSTYKINYI